MKKEIFILIVIVFIPVFGLFIGYFLSISGEETSGTYTVQQTAQDVYRQSGSGSYQTMSAGSTKGSSAANNSQTAAAGQNTAGTAGIGYGNTGNTANTANSGYTPAGSTTVNTYNTTGQGGARGTIYESEAAATDDMQGFYELLFHNMERLSGQAAEEAIGENDTYAGYMKRMKALVDVNSSGSGAVTMSFDAKLFAGASQADLNTFAENPSLENCTSIKINADGSVTCVMTREAFYEFSSEVKDFCNELLTELANEGDSVFYISANDNFSQFSILTYHTELAEEEGLFLYFTYIPSVAYHVFNGTSLSGVEVSFINYPSGVTIGTANSRDF